MVGARGRGGDGAPRGGGVVGRRGSGAQGLRDVRWDRPGIGAEILVGGGVAMAHHPAVRHK